MNKLISIGLLLLSSAACGSQALTNLVDAAAAQACFAAYTNNMLRIEAVEPSEWNPSRRLDRLPFDQPFQLVVGTDPADRAAAEAALTTVVTSMPTHIRAYFTRHRLIAPLQQWMIRRFKPGVSNEAQYVTAAAHPNVWQAKDFDLGRLAAAAQNLTSNNVPMLASIAPIFEELKLSPIMRAEPFVDYPDPRPEQVYETPFGAAVVLRAMEQRRKFRFCARGYPFQGRKVNFRWMAKARGIPIGPLSGNWDYPPAKGYGEVSLNWSAGRRDVLVFARYGEGAWGPPSVISFYGLPNERRQYDRSGRILSIEYLVQGGVIPQLYQLKPWKDVFVRDVIGNVIGFQRTRTGEFRDALFSNFGEQVLETYAGDVPKETAKVRYFTRKDDPLTLDYEVLEETVQHPNAPVIPRNRGEFPPPKRKK